MFGALKSLFTQKDLRNKVMFIFLVLVIYRIGAHIPVPGIDSNVLENLSGGMFGLMNIFSGGALESFSIFALGVMPYITASIIIQLLSADVVPKLAELNKQGEHGRKKIKRITFQLAVLMSFIQGFAMSFGFNNMLMGSGELIKDATIWKYLMVALVLTIGSTILMAFGEKITKNGLGNGISILIFAGIIAMFPSSFMQLIATQYQADDAFFSIVKLTIIFAGILAIVVGAIFVLEAFRKIPIQYSERRNSKSMQSNALGQNIPSVNQNMYTGGGSSYLPIKINTAGVIPVIFAVAIMMIPTTLGAFMPENKTALWLASNFSMEQPIGMAIYAVLIFGFSYFYAFIQMDPEKMAENLQKSGGYVQGIRPGRKTEEYLSKILSRLTFVGGIFLVIVAILPIIITNLTNLPQGLQMILGTSMLIVIGVVLQTTKEIDGQVVNRSYRGFRRKR